MASFEPLYYSISVVATIAFIMYCLLPSFSEKFMSNKEKRKNYAIRQKELRKQQKKGFNKSNV